MVRVPLAVFGVVLALTAAVAYFFLAFGFPSYRLATGRHYPRTPTAPAWVGGFVATLSAPPDGGRGSSTAAAPTPRLVLVSFDWPSARLGNKMFQFAATLGVARHHNWPLTVMLDEAGKSAGFAQMKSLFRIDAKTSADRGLLQSAQRIDEPGWGLYNAAVESASTFTKPVVTLMGYIQSWKYFGRHMDEIRRQYALTQRYADAAHSFLRGATPSAATSSNKATVFVGLHVRRGDMLRWAELYTAAPAGYIGRATKFYLDKFEPSSFVMFLVATDDWPWLNGALKDSGVGAERVVAVKGSAEMDFAVLSSCNHSIITGGTYGWWSAFLTGGDVVYYKDFISKSSGLYGSYEEEEYYLPHWIGMA